MSSVPPHFGPSSSGDRPQPRPGFVARWAAMHEAAAVVAVLAGLPAATLAATGHDSAAAIAEAGGWRSTFAEQGLDDMAAILEAGITALLRIHETGASAAIPARALWHEFLSAREGLLALAPPAAPDPCLPG